MASPLKSLDRYARIAAHVAIQKSPKPVQALFKHTDEHRRRKMRDIYRKGNPVDPSKGTLLFWVPGGMPLLLHVELAIAAAMKLRGYNVHAIVCNSPFRGCAIRTVQEGVPISKWRDVCPMCIRKTTAVLETMGIPFSYNGDFLSEEEREQIWQSTEELTWDTVDTLEYNGMNIGQNVRSSITRYLQGAALTGHEAVVREYAYSGLIQACAADRAFERFKPWRIFMSHGVYIDWGPALHLAFERGIPVTGWKASYLSSHFYMRHVADPLRIDFKKLSSEAWERLRSRDLTPEEEGRLEQFLVNRYHNKISFDMKSLKTYRKDVSDLKDKYAPGDKPVWAVLAHINWDSVSDYSPMAYPSFDDWMIDTIKHAIEITDVQWLIKIHPIEAWDNPASGVQRLVEREFPNLPPHVRVIPAEEDISPANMFELIDGGVTVYGTAGLELALMGKPVILGGEAHYGGLGFTHEGLTPIVYRQLLRKAAQLGPLNAEQRANVRKYAYSHFVLREIPLPVVRDPSSQWWNMQWDKRELLLPGNEPFIQFVCDRLIDGKDFSMPEPLVALAQKEPGAA